MKNLYKLHFFFFILVIGCSNSDNSINIDNNAEGTIQLSGEDTSEVGTALVVGDIAEGRADLTGIENSIIIVEKGTTISNNSAPFPPGDPRNIEIFEGNDPNNGFVIVVGADSISMSIVVNGTPFRYACVSGFTTFIDCGSADLNLSENKIIFNNSTVENTSTGSILTLNGTVTW